MRQPGDAEQNRTLIHHSLQIAQRARPVSWLSTPSRRNQRRRCEYPSSAPQASSLLECIIHALTIAYRADRRPTSVMHKCNPELFIVRSSSSYARFAKHSDATYREKLRSDAHPCWKNIPTQIPQIVFRRQRLRKLGIKHRLDARPGKRCRAASTPPTCTAARREGDTRRIYYR